MFQYHYDNYLNTIWFGIECTSKGLSVPRQLWNLLWAMQKCFVNVFDILKLIKNRVLILILTLLLNLNGIDILSRYSSSVTVERENNIGFYYV